MNRDRRETSGIPGRAILAACLVLGAAGTVAGCGDEHGSEPIDTVQLNLDFGGGVALTQVVYVLTGPHNFRQSSTLDVADQATITTTFQNLPAGNGYDINVQGTANDNLSSCKGEVMFNVAAMSNTVVQIPLVCSGRATVSADVNICPTIDSLSVVPAEVFVGASMQVAVVAHDPDNGPSPLSASWSSTSGTLSNLSTMGATFTCTTAGTFKIGVAITDGTPAQKCTDNASVMVVCTPGAV